MCPTTQDQPTESIRPQETTNRAAQHSTPVENDVPAPSGELAELDSLFCAHTLDLRRVGDAVRVRPGLEALVLRLTDSLALSSDPPFATVEEAAVVLGRDRLRVLVHTWALLESAREKRPSIDREKLSNAQRTGGDDGAGDSVPRWTPETLYLSTFLHWFGLQGRVFPDAYANVRADFELVNATAEDLIPAQRRFPGSSFSAIAEYFSGLFERSLSSNSAAFQQRLFELAAAARDCEGNREGTSRPGDDYARQISRKLSGHLSSLAEILERDFVALLPYLEAAVAKPRQKAAAAGGARSFRGKAE
jgi:hypothetical protein